MSFLFGGTKLPATPTPAPPATDINKIKEEEKKKIRKGATKSTILTSSQGVLEPAEVKRKTLLGE